MKVVIFGASGIIGAHLRLCVPPGVEPIWMRREADALHRGLDLLRTADLANSLTTERPNVIINLAGESRTDVVERDPDEYYDLNVIVPDRLAHWCERNNSHHVHISTQAVFNGEHPPYHPKSQRQAVNEYGRQKIFAEESVERVGSRWTIVRPTFVLGVRPVPTMGRENPIEQMLTAPVQRQVSDRWFSVSFARDVAADLWKIALGEPLMKAVHIGIPHGVTRYDLAATVSCLPGVTVGVDRAKHGDFAGIAPRPVDTTFADAEGHCTYENVKMTGQTIGTELGLAYIQAAHKSARLINAGLDQCQADIASRNSISVEQRARELSLFTGTSEEVCAGRLNRGFHQLHSEVAVDFRNAVRQPCSQCKGTGAVHGDHDCPACVGYGLSVVDRRAPQSDEELLEWYRTTDKYCWELSAYHSVPQPGFNYAGSCRGIADRLETASAKRVLAVGDGIGDLTLSLARRGFDAVYHDLLGSKTAAFANLRYWMYLGKQMPFDLSADWNPSFGTGIYDAIVALDVLEHVTDVEAWVLAIYAGLKPGGLLMSQNAFACGSGPEGSIPMHLAKNDRFEYDWDPLLAQIGFRQLGPNWYEKPKG